jgi:hypothetical protein
VLIASTGPDVTTYSESRPSGCSSVYEVASAANNCASTPCLAELPGLAPSPPAWCSAEPTCNESVLFSWEALPWADGYRVFRDELLLATTPAGVTTYVDVPPVSGPFQYSVAALEGGCESASQCTATAAATKPVPIPSSTSAPKIALHARSYVSAKVCQNAATLTCPEAIVQAPVNEQQTVYLLVADVDAGRGVAGVQFGIDYGAYSYATTEGVWVNGFTLCADLAFTGNPPHDYPPPPTGGGGGGHHVRSLSAEDHGPVPLWPEPNSGAVITWGGCQTSEPGGPGTGVVAVVGFLDVTAYGAGFSGRLWLTPLPTPSPQALVADCSTVAIAIPPENLGSVGFGNAVGFNPCSSESLFSSPASCWTTAEACWVQIGWGDLPDETGYIVFRDGGHLAELPADITLFVDYPPPGEPHTYGVAAVGPSGISPQCLSAGPHWVSVPEQPGLGVLGLRAERNPFTPPAGLAFEIPAPGDATLVLYSVSGRMVRRYDLAALPGGPGRLLWDGRDDRGVPVGPGIYFARLTAAGHSATQRLVVLK